MPDDEGDGADAGQEYSAGQRAEDQRQDEQQAPEAGELDASPAHDPPGQGPDHGPGDRDGQRIHCVRASRIASTGAGFPVQISNDRAPWATNTPQPSAVRRPSDRALRTSGVPPAT